MSNLIFYNTLQSFMMKEKISKINKIKINILKVIKLKKVKSIFEKLSLLLKNYFNTFFNILLILKLKFIL